MSANAAEDATGEGALRVPLYPLFVLALTGGERAFAPLLVAHCLVGAGSVVVSAWIGAQLFGARVGLTAAGLLCV